jgi:hypothetical protein
VTTATGRLEGGLLTRVAAGAFAHATQLDGPGPLGRAAAVAGDLMGAVAIAFCIPFVILAIATPIALGVGLLAWLAGLR